MDLFLLPCLPHALQCPIAPQCEAEGNDIFGAKLVTPFLTFCHVGSSSFYLLMLGHKECKVPREHLQIVSGGPLLCPLINISLWGAGQQNPEF